MRLLVTSLAAWVTASLFAAGCVTGEAPPVCEAPRVAQAARPNMLFALDRSGSMHLKVHANATRWKATKYALFAMLDDLEDRANGGILMFPSDDSTVTCCPLSNPNCGKCFAKDLPGAEQRCSAASYHGASIGLLSTDHVATLKAKVSASDKTHFWGTPLTAALQGASDTIVAAADGQANVIVLLTDGRPTACENAGGNHIDQTVEVAKLAAELGVLTYVVGVVGGHPAADAEHLSAIAIAGQTARYAGCEANDDCAYSVRVDSFEDDLADALETIARQVTSCVYESGDASLDIAVTVALPSGEHKLLNRDEEHKDGWDYLANGDIRLYGTACDDVQQQPQAVVELQPICSTR